MTKFCFDFILTSTPSMTRWSLPFRSTNYNFICLSQFSHACHMTHKTNPYSNTVWYNVQSMELLCTYFHQISCYLAPATIQINSSAPCPQHPHCMFFQQCAINFHTHTHTHTYAIYIQKTSHFRSLTKNFKLNGTENFLNVTCSYFL